MHSLRRGCGVAGPFSTLPFRSMRRPAQGLRLDGPFTSSLIQSGQRSSMTGRIRIHSMMWRSLPYLQPRPYPFLCMQLTWQSRVTTDTGVEITETGRTVTLGLDLTTMRHPGVQGLINHWSTQVITCAFSEPPSLAVLQVARFQGAGKYQGLVSCQSHILLPVFRDDSHVDVDRMPYSLQAACIHVGDQLATTGHYRALLWDEGNGRFLLSDDGQCVDVLLTMSAANELLSRYCYLLFYLRSTHR